MPKDTKTLGNNKAWACESLGFVHKKRLCQRFDTTSCYEVYGDPLLVGQVARFNNLNGYRNIPAGTEILLPMLKKA